MMSGVDLDCRGLKCPEPVLKTKRMLEGAAGSFTVMVDNETARDNVARFATTSGCEVEVSEVEGGFVLRISGVGPSAEDQEQVPGAKPVPCGTVFLIKSDLLGTGERELGEVLMRSFLYASGEAESAPASIILMNSGVKLVTENQEAIAHLKRLEERGVDIIVCGTCLDYYGLTERLAAGRVSNMYEIQSTLIGATNLVSL
jgi:selenium metabolism protein YedF